MNSIVLDFDLVVFGFDFLVNFTYLLWPPAHRTRPVLFLWPGAWAVVAAVAFRDHPWAASVFAADFVLAVVMAWKNRK